MCAFTTQFKLDCFFFFNILPTFCFNILNHDAVNSQKSSSAFLFSSLLVTVLESFHFDHQTLSREMEAAKAREGELLIISACISSLYETC